MYGPPANTPIPLNVDEYAYPSWLAMKPPDERPETVVFVVSTLSLGSGTAACAVSASARAAAPARARTAFWNVIEHLLGWLKVEQPLAPRVPGGSSQSTEQKGARPRP